MAKGKRGGVVLRGKKYGYDFWHHGVRHNRTVGTRQEAQTALDVLWGQLQGGVTVATGGKHGKLTVQAFHDQVYRPRLDGGDGSKITAENDGYVLRRFCAMFGARGIETINETDFDTYKADRRKADVSNGTVGYDLRRLRAFFSLAVERKVISENPIRGGRNGIIPKAEQRLGVTLKQSDEARFFSSFTNDTARDLFRVAFFAALRRQDALGLKWSNVDLETATLTIKQEKVKHVKVVPLLPEAVAILKARCPKDADPDGFVFTVRGGAAISEGTWAGWWKEAVTECKLKGLRPHDLRHSLAQRLDARRFGVTTIGKILGHAAPYHTTARYINDVSQDQLRVALTEALAS